MADGRCSKRPDDHAPADPNGRGVASDSGSSGNETHRNQRFVGAKTCWPGLLARAYSVVRRDILAAYETSVNAKPQNLIERPPMHANDHMAKQPKALDPVIDQIG